MPDRYVLDACVLFPALTRDLLLTLAADGAYAAIWTDEIIDEMRRNIVVNHPDIEVSKLDSNLIATMNGALPAARLTGFEHLIAEMDNDPKDRHVAAAAAHAEATGILTYNLRDFRGAEILKRCIRIITPAVFVEKLISEAPDTIAQAILKMSRRRLRPPMTPRRDRDLDRAAARLRGAQGPIARPSSIALAATDELRER